MYSGVIVAGPPGSGKSACIQTMVDALSVQTRAISRQSHTSKASASTESQHKLLRINPMVVDDPALMFGALGNGNNHEWVDGIFTHAVRKANRVSFILCSKNLPLDRQILFGLFENCSLTEVLLIMYDV